MNNYEQRDRLLLELGFSSYSGYLASDTWRSVRRRVMELADCLCRSCAMPAVQVHHRQYTKENLRGVNINGLVPLCVDCHKAIELRADGTKTSMDEANAILDVLIGATVPENKKRPGWVAAQKARRQARNKPPDVASTRHRAALAKIHADDETRREQLKKEMTRRLGAR